MRILITGATGFVGGHLAEALVTPRPESARGAEIHGTSLTQNWPPALAHFDGHVTLHVGDLTDADHWDALLRDSAPDQIYHLAGYAATGSSFAEPDAAWAGNVGVAQAMFDAIRRWDRQPRIVFASSALIYAAPDSDRALDEDAPIAPLSPYAESKAAADRLAAEAARDFDVIRVRPFNHIGPRQSPQFAVASFAQQLARIELGLAPPRLETGDLSTRRDFTDVRDIVRAYVPLMQHGQRGEAYNAGSGAAVAMRDIVESLCGLCTQPVAVATAADRLRPSDAPVLIANTAKLRHATGWSPQIPLERTLADTLDFWRQSERSASTSTPGIVKRPEEKTP